MKAKRRLRAALRDRRAHMPPELRRQASRQIGARLLASRQWAEATSVAFFHSMPSEVDTRALIEAAWASGRRVALPTTPPLGEPLLFRWVLPNTELVAAHYGAMEPGPDTPVADLGALELVVTPGLGFDRSGARLGYGGGYYDRSLAVTRCPRVMLAFACQEVVQVPVEAHDVRMTAVVTEREWWEPGNRSTPGTESEPRPS